MGWDGLSWLGVGRGGVGVRWAGWGWPESPDGVALLDGKVKSPV